MGLRMATVIARIVVGFGLWFVVLPVMTFVLGVPSTLKVVTAESRGGLLMFAGWLGASWAGWLPQSEGPAGMPLVAFWIGTVVFGLWLSVRFVQLSKSAWGAAIRMHRLMGKFGMPPQEII